MMLEKRLGPVQTLEEFVEEIRSTLVHCDSELSAIAHGRPPSSKEELNELYYRCRRLSDRLEIVQKGLNLAGMKSPDHDRGPGSFGMNFGSVNEKGGA